jgi:NAD(P)H-flavin reductase
MKNDKGFKYQEYEIIDKEELAPETFLFTLQGKFDFLPGQFVQAMLPRYGNITLAPCSDPENKTSFQLCVRSAGSASLKINELSPGDNLKIRGPYGKGWPISALLGKNVTLIAGGMGLVPLRPLLNYLAKYRSEYKKINILAGFRTDHHIIFRDELLKLKKKFSEEDIVVEHIIDKDFPATQGLITDPLKKIKFDKNSVVLICGPEVMTDHCIPILVNASVDEKNIFISYERRMECGIGMCQHCNIGKYKVCEDGPVFSYDKIKSELDK